MTAEIKVLQLTCRCGCGKDRWFVTDKKCGTDSNFSTYEMAMDVAIRLSEDHHWNDVHHATLRAEETE